MTVSRRFFLYMSLPVPESQHAEGPNEPDIVVFADYARQELL